METSHTTSKGSLSLAIITSLLSSLSFTAALCLSKTCLTTCSVNQVSFFKAFFSLIPAIFMIFKVKKNQSFFAYLKTNHPGIHLFRGLSGFISVYLFLLALRTLSLAETTLLFNTTPLFVPFVAYLWKRSPIDHKVWPGLIVAFLGMIFLLHPQAHFSNAGLYFALLSGMVGAITILIVRFSHTTEPIFRTVFYYGVSSLIFAGICCLMEGFPFEHLLKPSIALGLLGVGLFGFTCQLFYTMSLKYAPAKLVAPLSYMAVIFGVILDFIFWQVKIIPSEIFGIVLVLLGLYFVTSYVHNRKKKNPALSESKS